MVGPGVAEEIVVRFEEEEGMLMTRREEVGELGMVLEINLRVLLHIKSASHRR